MEEYIKELQDKVGLTAEQAKKAIETIVGKVKSKIPESLHGAIDGVFSQQNADKVNQFRQQAEDYADQAGDKLKAFGQQAKSELNELSDQAEDLAQDVRDKAAKAAGDISDKLSEFFGGKKTPPPAENA